MRCSTFDHAGHLTAWRSVFAVVAKDAAVRVENLTFADETDITAIFDYRKIPGSGIVKYFHDFIHAFADFDLGRRYRHKLIDIHLAVEIGPEHNIADIIEQNDTEQTAAIVDDRKKVAV